MCLIGIGKNKCVWFTEITTIDGWNGQTCAFAQIYIKLIVLLSYYQVTKPRSKMHFQIPSCVENLGLYLSSRKYIYIKYT